VTLRARLALICLLVLSLPLAGWQLVRSLEQSLRASYQQTLIDTAAAAARELAIDAPLFGGTDPLYVHPAQRDLEIDGYADDWSPWLDSAQRIESREGGAVDLVLAERRGRLSILLRRPDDELTLAGAGRAMAGDRIRLTIETATLSESIDVAPLAPGWLSIGNPSNRIRGQAALQPGDRGWTLEMSIEQPRDLARIGLTVFDVDAAARSEAAQILQMPDRDLARPSPGLSRRLAALLPRQTAGWITGPDGWVGARAGRIEPPSPTTGTNDDARLATTAARWLGVFPRDAVWRDEIAHRLAPAMRPASAAARWYESSSGEGFVVSASLPLGDASRPYGHLVLARTADEAMIAAYLGLLKLSGFGLLSMLVLTVVLVGFAARLSNRIRRLRDDVDRAVSADGRILGTVPTPAGRDEIADLGRGLAGMVERQRQHQEYLRTLAGKLSHELRTPLAMIRSSLDNLSEVEDEAARNRYRQRAEAGCRRLQQTFQAMSQAARVEESLLDEAMIELDLGAFVERYAAGSRNAFVNHRIHAVVPAPGKAMIEAAPDQVAQLLDKLLENAVSFAPRGSRITLRVVPMHRTIALQVDNAGSRLPDIDPERLFDSMTARRQDTDAEAAHLGFGLFIVRMIAERHGARARAGNREDGVRFQVEFPRRSARGDQELP
jgi:signal transduction histidine kinase